MFLIREICFFEGVPPLPRSIGIIALARNSPQNPLVKELRYQNLDNAELRARRVALEQTVTASTMITQLRAVDKVRCHNDLWISAQAGLLCLLTFLEQRSGLPSQSAHFFRVNLIFRVTLLVVLDTTRSAGQESSWFRAAAKPFPRQAALEARIEVSRCCRVYRSGVPRIVRGGNPNEKTFIRHTCVRCRDNLG